MLKTLIAIQLRGLLGNLQLPGRRRKRGKPANKWLAALLVVYILGSLGISLGFTFQQMHSAFAPLGLTWYYFALVGLMAFVLSFIGSVFLAQSSLFSAKDNELLLSLPIPPRLILATRMASLYVFALGVQALVLLPALVVYVIYGSVRWAGLLLLLPAWLLLPLMTLTLSCLLGFILALVSSRLRHKNLVIILLSLGFLAAYFVGYSRLMRLMDELLRSGQQFADALRNSLPPAYHFGQAVAQGSLPSFLLYALFCLVPFGAVFYLLSRNYARVLSTKRGTPRVAYRGGGLVAGSARKALLVKECRRFFGSPVYLMNTGISLLFMLGLPIYLLFDRSLLVAMEQLGLPASLLGGLAIAAQTAMAGSVMISAPSISLEGKALWILKSLPVSALDVLRVKAAAHILISLPIVLLSGLAYAWLLHTSALDTIYLLLLPLLANACAALLGVALNLRFARFDWRTETEPVKQSMSTFLTMTIGFGTPGLLAALYAFWLADKVSLSLFMLMSALFFMLCGLALYSHLKKKADHAFLALGEG